MCVTVGDVAGSGLAAAVIMGRMRSALRAYALETTDPAEVLGKLDRKMQHFEPEALATHLPPVIARPGEVAVLAGVRPGSMIGMGLQARRPVSTLPVLPGT